MKSKNYPIENVNGHALVWQKFYFGGVEYCADGDGFFVVRETKEGFKLFDQGDFVCILPTGIDDALHHAEMYMRSVNGEMWWNEIIELWGIKK